LGDEEAPAPGVVGALGENPAILATISEEEDAVSILAVGALTDEVVGLAIVLPDGQVVEPTAANVANGRYPILRNLYFITDGPPEGLAAQFIEFTLSPEGQALVEKAGYVPVKAE
jgi:phosphate transport system substrate-binding protein